MYSITELKVGTKIEIDDAPFVVMSSHHSKQARGAGVMKTTIKNLLTGSVVQKTFQGNDKIKPADVGFKRAQYLYSDGTDYHFMMNDTFEQYSFSKESLGDDTDYLLDGMELDLQVYNGTPINIQLPPKVVLAVSETDPGVKGDTASGGSKPATLETGKVIQVPLFINVGDQIRVNTQTGEYVERASK